MSAAPTDGHHGHRSPCSWNLSDGPVVRTQRFHCWGPGSTPGWGTKSPHATQLRLKKKQINCAAAGGRQGTGELKRHAIKITSFSSVSVGCPLPTSHWKAGPFSSEPRCSQPNSFCPWWSFLPLNSQTSQSVEWSSISYPPHHSWGHNIPPSFTLADSWDLADGGHLATVSALHMNFQLANFQRCEHAFHQRQVWVKLQLALRLLLRPTFRSAISHLFSLLRSVTLLSCSLDASLCEPAIVLYDCAVQGTILQD